MNERWEKLKYPYRVFFFGDTSAPFIARGGTSLEFSRDNPTNVSLRIGISYTDADGGEKLRGAKRRAGNISFSANTGAPRVNTNVHATRYARRSQEQPRG